MGKKDKRNQRGVSELTLYPYLPNLNSMLITLDVKRENPWKLISAEAAARSSAYWPAVFENEKEELIFDLVNAELERRPY